jgi:hypothetical protein
MSNWKVNNKKNWMLEFTDVDNDEILYIHKVLGKKGNKVNCDKGIACAIDSMYWMDKDDKMIRNIKVRLSRKP